MNLSRFATSFTKNISGKSFLVLDTGVMIRASTTADPTNINVESIATSQDVSGLLLKDPDSLTYLVDKLNIDSNGLYRGPMFLCKEVVLWRYPVSSVDSFGRPVLSELTSVQTGIPLHFIISNSASIEQTPIMPISDIHRTALVQSSIGIVKTDIIKTADNDTFRVTKTDVSNFGITELTMEQLS